MLSRRYTEKDLAYRLYLRGRFHWHQRSVREIRRAISYFRKALSEDPEYAPAYSALSSSYSLLPMVSPLRPHELLEKACREKEFLLILLGVDDCLASLRSHRAFQTILARIGLS